MRADLETNPNHVVKLLEAMHVRLVRCFFGNHDEWNVEMLAPLDCSEM